jgi:hypothetical protein
MSHPVHRDPLSCKLVGLQGMSAILNDTKHWRGRADAARRLAEQFPDGESKATILNIATEYDRLVERAQMRTRTERLAFIAFNHINKALVDRPWAFGTCKQHDPARAIRAFTDNRPAHLRPSEGLAALLADPDLFSIH